MRTLAAGTIGCVVASLVAAAISPSHHSHGRAAPPAALLIVFRPER